MFPKLSSTSVTANTHPCTFLVFFFVTITGFFCSSALLAFEITPFTTKNQSPLVQIYGIPSAGNAQLLPSGGKAVQIALDHASNYVSETNARESIILDGETTRVTFGGRYGLSERLEFGVEIPHISHSGGFLDQFIIDYHDFFGFPQGGRDRAPLNRLLYRYTRDGVETLKIDSARNGLGDISLSAGLQLYRSTETYPRAVALRMAIKFPTGDSASLCGSGSTDFSVWLTASDDYSLSVGHATLFGAAGLTVLTSGKVLPDQQRNHVGFGNIGIGWNPLPWIAFKVQLDAHTPLYSDSELKPLSANAAQLLIGGTLALTTRTSIDIAVSEDIVTTTAPDVVFHFNLKTQF